VKVTLRQPLFYNIKNEEGVTNVTKQLLIYDDVVAVDSEKHKNFSVKLDAGFNFAKEINSAPLLVTEFVEAAKEFSVVFSGDDQVMPVVILGIDDNAYVSDTNEWKGTYIPAFLRRYPFVFSSDNDGETFNLCLDGSFEGCNEDDIGERLFDAESSQTQYLKGVLDFLQTYQAHFQATQVFCKKREELDLLEDMEANYNIQDKKSGRLKGFKAVSREKLKALSDEQIVELMRSDHLELLYKHLGSMSNFTKMVESISQTMVFDS